MSCGKQDEGQGYIAPSEIKIENGVMTPEVLLSLGRLIYTRDIATNSVLRQQRGAAAAAISGSAMPTAAPPCS